MIHLKGLNEPQKKAVTTTEGPLLIIAGAGAGKTKTLTHRILHLIKKGVAPHQILAITFTNKAAKEMRQRVFDLIKKDPEINIPISFSERPLISTFHSLGVHILKEQAVRLGLSRNFSIFDRSDSMRAIKVAMKKLGYESEQMEPRKVLSVISREKGRMKTQALYEAGASDDFRRKPIGEIWGEYEKTLKNEGALDFDDLLLKPVLLLQAHADIREHYQNVWKYIHIDEYQDTNEVQYTLTKILAEKHQNICVVGDIDQNIYSWRGASIKNMMDFEKDYPDFTEIILEENYRSTQTILAVANAVIVKNEMRKEKNLFTKNADGDKVTIYNAYDENDEARFISEKVDELVRAGASPSEIAVLYRANFQSRVLEEWFLKAGLHYQVLGVKFFDRREVKDVLTFLKAALNPNDLSSLSRIVNVPPRGIGKVTFLKIAEGREADLAGKSGEKVREFRVLLERIRSKALSEKPSELIRFIVKYSGLEEDFKKDGDEGQERLENIKELATLGKKYDDMPVPDGVEKLLEDAALATDQDEMTEDSGGTKLMTIHASKGLEFDYVFITGLEEGLFPHEDLDGSREDNEEERRLFYVALTRARKKLFLSYSVVRTIYGSQQMHAPSSFLADIDACHTETEECDLDQVSRDVKEIFIDF